MAAAAGRIKRLKRIDRLAVGVITLGGMAVVVSVIGILVFIGAEAVPLFRAASPSSPAHLRLAESAAPAAMADGRLAATNSAGTSTRSKPTARSPSSTATRRARARGQPGIACGRQRHRLVPVADGRFRRRRARATDASRCCRCGSCRSIRTARRRTSRSMSASAAWSRSTRRDGAAQRVSYLEEGEQQIRRRSGRPTATSRSGGPDSGGAERREVVRVRAGQKVTAVRVGPHRHGHRRHRPRRGLPLGARRGGDADRRVDGRLLRRSRRWGTSSATTRSSPARPTAR